MCSKRDRERERAKECKNTSTASTHPTTTTIITNSTQLGQFHPRMLYLFRRQSTQIGGTSSKDLFTNTIAAHKLFGNVQGIAIEQFAQKGAQCGTVHQGQHASFEFGNQMIGVGFFFGSPLAAVECGGLFWVLLLLLLAVIVIVVVFIVLLPVLLLAAARATACCCCCC